MAVVLNPALSLAASGNLGPINYTRWRGMAVARSATTYTFTPSTAQTVYEGYLRIVTRAWGGVLTASQRGLWDAVAPMFPVYDRLSNRYTCTGYQMFVKLNMNRAVAGLGILTTPPNFQTKFLVTGLTVVTSGVPGIGKMHAVMPVPAEDPYLIQYWQAGPYDSPGRHATAHEYYLKGVVHPAGDNNTGSLVIGKYYWFRARGGQDSGVVGNWHLAQWQVM